jgi:hypothetical protein
MVFLVGYDIATARGSDLRMTALVRASNNCKRQTHPLVIEDVTKDCHSKCSVEKNYWS